MHNVDLYNGGINFSALYWQSFVISDHSIHFDRKLLDQPKSSCNQDIASTEVVKSDCAHCNIFYFLMHSISTSKEGKTNSDIFTLLFINC